MFDMVTELLTQACWLGTMYIGCNMKICRTPVNNDCFMAKYICGNGLRRVI